MDRSVEMLWSSRARAFWKESMPYISAMVQSGVPLVTSFLLIAGFAGYTTLIHQVDQTFPFVWIGVLVLTPVVCWNPLRTWLREADTVFLVPREAQMGRYLRRSFLYNGTTGLIGAAAVVLIYSLLYVKGPGLIAWQLLVIAVLAVKLLNAAAAWRERQLSWIGARRGMRVLRWIATAAGLAVLLKAQPWMGAVYFIAAAAVMALIYRGLKRYPVPWLTLIAEENATRRRFTVFFSAFADVPSENAQVSTRKYITWLPARLSFSKENAFAYLFAHTLIRTELGAIVLRLTAFGMIASFLAAYSALWSGWGSAGVCLLFLWLVGTQIASLVQSHRHSVWRHLYPLPDDSRLSALLKVDRIALFVCGALVWLPQAILLPLRGYPIPAAAAALLIALYALGLRPSRIKRSYMGESEED
ncbi:ABC transporter permease [Paenibacillus nasutitermitis]|uniref:ABC transporter permease n=1 Tax=Paenibacillus nasutitermitis TaxID=1652958 RepID=A0A916YLF9_9BACL|nr:ABC transporter permease [Paenibacillus nasutitermitis]GGD49553.1 ABC transporter permease [Paenibacillus nasutitermitis]